MKKLDRSKNQARQNAANKRHRRKMRSKNNVTDEQRQKTALQKRVGIMQKSDGLKVEKIIRRIRAAVKRRKAEKAKEEKKWYQLK